MIRVAFEALSPFLTSMVTPVVQDAEDMEFVGMSARSASKEPRDGPDVLLVGPETSDAKILVELRENPDLRVLRIESNGHDLTIHELRPHTRVHHDASPTLLLDVIRNAVRNGGST